MMQYRSYLEQRAIVLLWILPFAWMLLSFLSYYSPTLSMWGLMTSGSSFIVAKYRTRKAFVSHVAVVVSYAIIRVAAILISDSTRLASIGVWTIICVKSLIITTFALIIASKDGRSYGPVLD